MSDGITDAYREQREAKIAREVAERFRVGDVVVLEYDKGYITAGIYSIKQIIDGYLKFKEIDGSCYYEYCRQATPTEIAQWRMSVEGNL